MCVALAPFRRFFVVALPCGFYVVVQMARHLFHDCIDDDDGGGEKRKRGAEKKDIVDGDCSPFLTRVVGECKVSILAS